MLTSAGNIPASKHAFSHWFVAAIWSLERTASGAAHGLAEVRKLGADVQVNIFLLTLWIWQRAIVSTYRQIIKIDPTATEYQHIGCTDADFAKKAQLLSILRDPFEYQQTLFCYFC